MKQTKLKSVKHSIQDVEINPVGISINFSEYKNIKFKAHNIRNCMLAGSLTEKHLLNKANIIFCKTNKLFAKGADFTSTDIKDSHLYKSTFSNCYFNDAAFINNLVDSVKFYSCTFKMTSITGTHFYNVSFEDCDFTNVVINTCQFINCKFSKCKTSNKVIEMSFLYECRFYKTNLYLETILENFGINKNHLTGSQLKVDNKLFTKGKGLTNSLTRKIESKGLTSIEKFKLEYFENPMILIEGSDFLDKTYHLESWIELCAIPKSFSLLLENYHDFLIKNYDENKMPAWNLLKLHSMTGALLQQKISNQDVLRSISGVHLSLTRYVEDFLNLLTTEILSTDRAELILLVNGPLNESYYQDNLSPFFEQTDLKIAKVVKHNSPNELILHWMSIKDIVPVIAIFLATRFKLEFENVKKKNELKKKKESNNLLPVKASQASNELQSFSLELGFDKDESFLYQLKLKVLTPGNLLLNLQLGFNTRMFGKIKKILIDILSDGRKK